MATEKFLWRHIGPRPEDIDEMLKVVGVHSLDELIEQTVPESIRLKEILDLPAPLTEAEFFNRIREVAAKNKIYRSFILIFAIKTTLLQLMETATPSFQENIINLKYLNAKMN